MTEEKTKPDAPEDKPELLPATLVADLLKGETSLFFNVALFQHGQRIANMFARSTMVPDQFRDNIGNCMIALNYASRINADPFMMMQCMYVVYGKPGIEGKLVAALINQSGKYSEPLQYQWIDDKGKKTESLNVVLDPKRDNRGCRAHTVDARSKKPVYGPLISWKIVHDEGWYADKPKKGGGGTIKSKWRTFPELMFMYRAASWFANINCPEVKLGMQTVEELRDVVELHPGPDGAYTSEASKDITEALKGNVQEKPEPKGKPGPDPEPEFEKKPEPDPKKEESEKQEDESQAADNPWIPKDKWWSMRTGNFAKGTGFKAFCVKNKDSFSSMTEIMQAEVRFKFKNFYPDEIDNFDTLMGLKQEEELIKEKFICSTCKEEFDDVETLKQHIKDKHAHSKNDSFCTNGHDLYQREDGKFVCHNCPYITDEQGLESQEGKELSSDELFEEILKFDPGVKQEVFRRLELGPVPVLKIMSYDQLKEIWDMCIEVRAEQM